MSNIVKDIVYNRLEQHALYYKIDHGYQITGQEMLTYIFYEADEVEARICVNLTLLELSAIFQRLKAAGLLTDPT